jgi:hypothetical protein
VFIENHATAVVNSVARSQQAFTATPAQNHGHLATFHGHKFVQYGYIHGQFNKEKLPY